MCLDSLNDFLVESAQEAVNADSRPGSSGLSNGPDSEQPRGLSDADTIGASEDIRAPFVRPTAGQATPYVETHSPAHVPGRGENGSYCVGAGEEEVALSSGEMNRAE